MQIWLYFLLQHRKMCHVCLWIVWRICPLIFILLPTAFAVGRVLVSFSVLITVKQSFLIFKNFFFWIQWTLKWQADQKGGTNFLPRKTENSSTTKISGARMKNLTKNCTNTLQCAMGKRQFMLYGLSVNQLAHQKNSGPKWPPRRLQKLQTKIVACTRNLRAILLFFTMFY